MKLHLTRTDFTENSTIGELFINGAFFCYTLEDTIRPVKIKRETAISTGMYKVVLTMSNKFKKVLPLLVDVSNFEGIRIHSGNHKDHTEGCILVGMTKAKDFIGMSKIAMAKLMEKLKGQNNITILIE